MYKFNTNDFLVRIPLFIIFFWFGFLKIINLSPAQELVMDTVYWMPFLDAATQHLQFNFTAQMIA